MILECDKISKFFQETQVLRDCTFNLSDGEILGIMGESGCGKSTLSKIIAGIESPSSGAVRFNGQLYVPKNRENHPILVFQDAFHSVNPNFSVRDVLTEAVPRISDIELQNLLAEVGLKQEYLHRRARDLSGGQLQRVCIARALLLQPKIIIFDEALTGLDPIIQGKLLHLLFRLRTRYKLSYIFISHDFMLCYAICHRVLVMNQGQFIQEITELEKFNSSQFIKLS